MDRRSFLRTVVAGGAVTLLASNAEALKLFPNAGKQRWAVLFGSRYGTTRDASVWISEGMGLVADVFDVRENPDLAHVDAIVIGTGIYMGKMDRNLEAYLAKNGTALSARVKALFAVCGGGDTPRAQAYIEALAKASGAKPALTKVFPGRLTRRLLVPEDYKIEEGVAKRMSQPFEDYDRLQRKDCLKFGEDILAKA